MSLYPYHSDIVIIISFNLHAVDLNTYSMHYIYLLFKLQYKLNKLSKDSVFL